MKKLFAAVLFALALGPWRPAFAETVYSADLVNDISLGADANYDLDLNLAGIQELSFTAAYSTSLPTQKTFDDGRKSTATILVSSYTALVAQTARTTVTISSFSALGGASLTLNGVRFKEGAGGEWTKGANGPDTAEALKTVIDAHADFTAVRVTTVVFVEAAVAGAFGNSYTCVSSTAAAMTCGAATFGQGQDNARLVVNGERFDAGTDFTPGASAALTAKAISDALMANANVAAVIISTHTNATVFATSTVVGTNAYTLYTSTPLALRLNGSSSDVTATFLNGLDPDIEVDGTYIDLSSDTLRVQAHGLNTGYGVYITTASGSMPTGLTWGTTYYAIKTNYDLLQLATSKANATAGTAVNITALTGNSSFRLNPIARSGNPSFKWQVSNDGTNFFDLAVDSVTVTGTSVTGWDFGTISYRKLRLKYTAPTFGGADIRATGTGRR